MGERSGDPGAWLRAVAPGSLGKVRVRLSVDMCVDLPVEVEVVSGPMFRECVAFAGLELEDVDGIFGYVGPEMLGISRSLAEDLRAFQRWWEEHGDPLGDASDQELDAMEQEPEWLRWEATGWQLLERLRRELGPRYDVQWLDMSPE